MTNTLIYISIVANSDDTTDVELLDEEPTEEFREGLWEALAEGRIQYFQIRAGFVNGGDSSIEYASNG